MIIEKYKYKAIEFYRIKLENLKPFTITCDLKPGKYCITSRLPRKIKEPIYDDAIGTYFEIYPENNLLKGKETRIIWSLTVFSKSGCEIASKSRSFSYEY